MQQLFVMEDNILKDILNKKEYYGKYVAFIELKKSIMIVAVGDTPFSVREKAKAEGYIQIEIIHINEDGSFTFFQ